MSVFKGILLNGAANVVQKVVRILDQLLLVPFFLTQWGAEYYGEWLTLTIIPTMLALSDLGFGVAVGNSFVLAYTSGDKQKAADIVKNGLLIITASVILGVILTIILLLLGDQFHIFEKSLIEAHEAMIAVTIMMAARLIGFYTHMIYGLYRSERKAHIGTLINAAQNAINVVAGFCVLLFGYKIIGFALSQLIVELIGASIFIFLGFRVINLEGLKGKINMSTVKFLASKGFGYFLVPIWSSLFFQGSTFVVRVALGPEAVAVFNTIRTACRSINQMFSVINGSIFPDMQCEYGRGNVPMVQKIFRIAMLITIFIAVFGVGFLMLFGLDVYTWWTQSVLSVDLPVWYVFISGILFNAMWSTAYEVYRVTNQPYRITRLIVPIALLSVIISYVLADTLQFGLMGAVIGNIAFDAIMMLVVLPDVCKVLNMKLNSIFANLKCDFIMVKQILLRKKHATSNE